MAHAVESSLMRRTKKELVDIILRKDDVEKENAKTIANLKEKISEKDVILEDFTVIKKNNRVYIEKLEKDVINLDKDNSDYRLEIDNLTTENKSLKAKIVYVAIAAVVITSLVAVGMAAIFYI